MFKKRIELKYYGTYYYASIVQNVIIDILPYAADLEAFWGGKEYKAFFVPFQKYSAFHQFIEFIIRGVLLEEINEIDLDEEKALSEIVDFEPSLRAEYERLPIEQAFLYYDLKHESFTEYLKTIDRFFKDASADDVYEYYNELELSGPLSELVEKITEEVFQIMFLNRNALLQFNEHVADKISKVFIGKLSPEDRILFNRDGVLKRVRIPQWAKQAVFHRDKGKCTLCYKDISGLLSLQNSSNFDHIIPLAKGGINDIANLQLLCKECNSKKKHYHSITSEYYERWY